MMCAVAGTPISVMFVCMSAYLCVSLKVAMLALGLASGALASEERKLH